MAASGDGDVYSYIIVSLYRFFFPFFSYSLSVPKIVMMIFRWLLSGSSLSKKELSDTPVNQDLTRPRPITHAGYNRSDSNLIRQSYNLNWPILYSKMPNKLDEKKNFLNCCCHLWINEYKQIYSDGTTTVVICARNKKAGTALFLCISFSLLVRCMEILINHSWMELNVLFYCSELNFYVLEAYIYDAPTITSFLTRTQEWISHP